MSFMENALYKCIIIIIMMAPLDISAVDRAIAAKNLHNGSVQCNLQDCIFRFSKIF